MTVNIANRQVVNDMLMQAAERDRNVVVLTSDSRGSASIAPFAQAYPKQFIEVGIAEQNIVGIAAGLASTGKKPFVLSPACFLSMRSIEQVKVDAAYSNTNVKLVGISGGVSYGSLGMTHHSLQDIAVTRAIPNLTVVLPSDRFETQRLTQALVEHYGPVYVRIGRNPVRDVYESEDYDFKIGRAVTVRDGADITIIGTGETVRVALDAADLLAEIGISAKVLNMHTLKPLDRDAILEAAENTRAIITIEEHSIYGGLGAAVAEVVVQNRPVSMRILGIADEPTVTGASADIFRHYGMTAENVRDVALEILH